MDYLTYMSVIRGKSRNTVNEYFLDLRTFFRYIKKIRRLVPADVDFGEITVTDVDLPLIKTVTLDDAYSFMLFLQSERQNTARTRARKVSSLMSFFEYLTNRKMMLDKNPISELDAPKSGKRLPIYLNLEQCYQLLNAIDGEYRERDYCILILFLNCGMRLSELCSINYNSISGNKLKIIGKGNKERTVYLNNACLDAVEAYMKVRPADGLKEKDKYALFISRRKTRLSNKSVQALVNKYIEKAGLGGQGFSVHKLRHTAATLMYQYGGVDIRVLQEILGHENLGTTEIYTHLSDVQMESAVESNPLSKMSPKKPDSKE